MSFEYNGKIYKIINDRSPYNIAVETNDNIKLFFEVKFTRKEFGNKVSF